MQYRSMLAMLTCLFGNVAAQLVGPGAVTQYSGGGGGARGFGYVSR